MIENAEMVCLIKPQFEAGRAKVGKKGVVRDLEVHKEVLIRITSEAVQMGFEFLGLDFSPIKGPEGNIEYLLYVKNNAVEASYDSFMSRINEVITNAQEQL
jgi:23S rRNA (cytidine1920-2'-O)/16S rRNA (cytidine1409-2'-O)-methyltransferase